MKIKNAVVIGQHIPGTSIIHELNARVKIIEVFLIMISIFFIKNIYAYIVLFSLFSFIIVVSKIPVNFLIRGLKPIVFLLLFTTFIQVFFTKGDVVFSFYFIKITHQGLYMGAFIFLRVLFITFFSLILTATTSALELSNAIEDLLKVFSFLKLPATEIALIMSIALRFIPTILEETERIINAQVSRGAVFNEGNIVQKTKSLIPILVPLFIGSFRRADELAIAMESRCFGIGIKRTRYVVKKIKAKDIVSLFVTFCISLLIIIL